MTLYNEVERTKDYVIYILADLEKLKLHIKKYNVSSLKWNMHHSVDTVEEAKEWLATVNSHECISPETIYNSKVIQSFYSYFPNWLLDKVGLHYGDLEDITQDKIVIKTHVSFCPDHKSCIEVYSVWFEEYPVLVAVEGRSDKNGDDITIKVIDRDFYIVMVEYLYKLKAEQVLDKEDTTTFEDISLVWGYFTEDLLNEN